MKTKLILTGTLFTLLMVGFASVGEQHQLSFNCENQLQNNPSAGPSEMLLKGIVYNGQVISLVELPEVTIHGKRNPETLTKAKLINGEIVSVIDLEEVIIYPKSTNL